MLFVSTCDKCTQTSPPSAPPLAASVCASGTLGNQYERTQQQTLRSKQEVSVLVRHSPAALFSMHRNLGANLSKASIFSHGSHKPSGAPVWLVRGPLTHKTWSVFESMFGVPRTCPRLERERINRSVIVTVSQKFCGTYVAQKNTVEWNTSIHSS